MGYRNLLIAAVITATLAGFTGIAESSLGETIAVENGIAVKESDVAAPGRGMTMDQVAAKFGEPTNKVPAVGQPPISRWDYPGFVVYFERNHVIHSVIANS
jgi:outer membrane protein assembly factor BamE (lipoprotein component of BamABCDE complex)